jgi:hypothetical protein
MMALFVRIATARRDLAKARFPVFPTGIVLSLLFLAGTMAGQSRTGNIYGTISDEDGIPLSKVHVTLSAPGISPLSTETGPTGLYRFTLLSPGSGYEITAELTGFKKTTKTGVIVQARANAEINITLERLSAVVSKWRAAKVAFNGLMKEPSPLTTREFYLSISGEVESDKTEILDYIFGPYFSEIMPGVGRFSIIAIEMLSGDVYAARSAIRILRYVQDEWQKPPNQKLPIFLQIGASLGTLIRANPSLFLRAWLEERESPFLREKGIPYGYPPFILQMKKSMLSYEMEMRKEAVRSVDDPQLKYVRDECLDLIEKGTQVFEAFAVERPRPWESTVTEIDVAPEAVKKAILEMMARPSPENMMIVLALFDERREEHRFLEAALFPLISISSSIEPPREIRPDPLEIIFLEAKCGNPYAIQIVFTALLRAFRAWDDLASQWLFEFISDLILRNPAVFIENVAKFTYLESERLDTAPITYLDAICGTIDFHAYPNEIAKETILRRRIAALSALNMPEHKELIARCIRLIEKNLK